LPSSLRQREPSKIRAILEGVFDQGAEWVRLTNSQLAKNWTCQADVWYQDPEGMIFYISGRMRFDQIFCQTLAQAEQVVKNLQQMDIYWALRRDYT
jgi:hypothetical protein